MSLPENALSSIAISAALLPPDNSGGSLVADYERGGLAISDPSLGLNYQDWRCYISGGSNVMIEPLSVGTPTAFFNQAGIEELSFTFDQNMRPAVAYVLAGGTCYLRWFDPVPNQYVTEAFPGGLRSPKLSLDDKRDITLALNSDMLFFYISGSNLCYRQQRDRFTVERVLRENIPSNIRIKNVGMNRGLRVQIEVSAA